MSSPGLHELREGKREFDKFYQRLWHKRLSRRKVIRVGALVSLLGASGAAQALIAACGGGEEATGVPSSPGATGTAAPFAGVTGDWDTTGTPPYKNGLPDDAAKIPEQWKQYPWIYKYGSWRYNWNIPVTRGGSVIVPWAPAADYNIMISGTASRPTNSTLYNAGLREGLETFGAGIEPELAIKEEHNADYTSWTFTIPENAKIHNNAPDNGRALTADDVAFSFERHRDTNVNRTILNNVDKVTAVDKTHIRFDLKKPQLSFTATLSFPNFPIFAQEHFENQDLFKKQAIGTGPYILQFSEFQNKAEWGRNPEYWELPPIKREKYGNKPLPFVDKFTRQFFANNLTAQEAFLSGQVDEFAPSCNVQPDLLKDVLVRIPDAVVIVNGYYASAPLNLILQYKNPLFQDIRVRKALSMAINREQVWSGGMDKTGLFGAAPVGLEFTGRDAPLPLKDYGPNAQFNPQQAKQLLQEAGYQEPLKLQVYQTPTLASTPAWQGALDTVVFNWKQAGIANAELVVRDSQVVTQDKLNKSFPDIVWEPGSPLAQGYTLDTLLPPALLPGSPRNYGSLDDPTLAELVAKLPTLTDPTEIPKLARQIDQRVVENVDNLWVGWWSGGEMYRGWLHGMVINTHNCVNGIGQGSYKYMWIDDTAPGGRGGKPV